MQTFLVVVAVFLAIAYLVWFGYKHLIAKKHSCEGCAFNKMYQSAHTKKQ